MWGAFYIVIEVAIGHLQPIWLLPGAVAFILNIYYFNNFDKT